METNPRKIGIFFGNAARVTEWDFLDCKFSKTLGQNSIEMAKQIVAFVTRIDHMIIDNRLGFFMGKNICSKLKEVSENELSRSFLKTEH